MLCQRTVPGAPCDAALFCVFDGHNGRSAADEVKVMLPKMLSERLPGLSDRLESASGLGDAWGAVYSKIDAAIQSEDGCTATTLLAWQDRSGRCCIQVHASPPACFAVHTAALFQLKSVSEFSTFRSCLPLPNMSIMHFNLNKIPSAATVCGCLSASSPGMLCLRVSLAPCRLPMWGTALPSSCPWMTRGLHVPPQGI